MRLVFNKLAEENLRQLRSNGYLGNVETRFEFISGQGKNLFIEVESSEFEENEKDFIFIVSCALLTGGAQVKEELAKLVYEPNQNLVMLDRFQPGNVEPLFDVDWEKIQPLGFGWLITCDPAAEVEALIFCEKMPLETSPTRKIALH